MRALVVEDEVVLREQIVTSLRAEGFAIDESGDGREGLYMATEMPIDIAIVDIGLPELDGLELVRQARTAGITVPKAGDRHACSISQRGWQGHQPDSL